MGGTTIADIPYEILLHIFTLASLSPLSGPPRWRTSTGVIPAHPVHKPIVDKSLSYRPFANKTFVERSNEWARTVQGSLDVKRSIVLVCKEWRQLGNELLYEAIRIDHGSEALFNALNRNSEVTGLTDSSGEDNFDIAKCVKRAEICTEMVDMDPFNPSLAWRILRSCPNLTTIVIPHSRGLALGRARWADENEPFFETGPSSSPVFPNLKVLECHIPSTAGPNRTADSGRIYHSFAGLLEQILDHAPTVERVTFAGGRWNYMTPPEKRPNGPKSFIFQFLTSLRIEADVEAIFHAHPDLVLEFPNLTHLIVGGALGAVAPVLKVCSRQIKVVELLDIIPDRRLHRWFEPTEPPKIWTIGDLLESCPNLQELNMPLSLGDQYLTDLDRISGTRARGCTLPELTQIHIKWTTPVPEREGESRRYIAKFAEFFVDQLEAKNLDELVLSGHGGQDEEWKWQPLIEKLQGCRRKFERVRIRVEVA